MRAAMSTVLALILIAAILLYFFGKPKALSVKRETARSIPPPRRFPEPAPAQPPLEWDTVEKRVLALTNQIRQAAGLQLLAAEDGLRATARAQSADMLARHFFDHVNPSGEDPSDRIGRMHRRLIGVVGENLWEATGASYVSNPNLAEVIVQGWIRSPHHRANILRPDFTHLGVGIVIDGNEVRATQNFSTVRAYLKDALPQRAAMGSPVNLKTDGKAPPPEMFDFQLIRKPNTATTPLPLADSHLRAKSGMYRLRFYFPANKGGFDIYEGPQIAIN